MEWIDSLLNHLNLSKKEFVIYQVLLKLGPTSIRMVAEQAQINRGTTHEILKALAKKGLVNFRLKGKRKQYVAQSPDKLAQLVSEKRTSLSDLSKILSSELIPSLKSQEFTSEVPTTEYFQGDEGIEQVLRDVLYTMKDRPVRQYFVFSTLPMRRYLYRLFPDFTKQRIKHKIAVKVIAIGSGGENATLAERKWLPTKDGDKFASYIIMYADKLVMITLTKDELPSAVVMQESGVTQTIKLLFKTLWVFL